MEKIKFTEEMFDIMINSLASEQATIVPELGDDLTFTTGLLLAHYFCTYAAGCDVTIDEYKTYCGLLGKNPDVMLSEAFIAWKEGRDASNLINYFRTNIEASPFYLAGCVSSTSKYDFLEDELYDFIAHMVVESGEAISCTNSFIASIKEKTRSGLVQEEKGFEYIKKPIGSDLNTCVDEEI